MYVDLSRTERVCKKCGCMETFQGRTDECCRKTSGNECEFTDDYTCDGRGLSIRFLDDVDGHPTSTSTATPAPTTSSERGHPRPGKSRGTTEDPFGLIGGPFASRPRPIGESGGDRWQCWCRHGGGRCLTKGHTSTFNRRFVAGKWKFLCDQCSHSILIGDARSGRFHTICRCVCRACQAMQVDGNEDPASSAARHLSQLAAIFHMPASGDPVDSLGNEDPASASRIAWSQPPPPPRRCEEPCSIPSCECGGRDCCIGRQGHDAKPCRCRRWSQPRFEATDEVVSAEGGELQAVQTATEKAKSSSEKLTEEQIAGEHPASQLVEMLGDPAKYLRILAGVVPADAETAEVLDFTRSLFVTQLAGHHDLKQIVGELQALLPQTTAGKAASSSSPLRYTTSPLAAARALEHQALQTATDEAKSSMKKVTKEEIAKVVSADRG